MVCVRGTRLAQPVTGGLNGKRQAALGLPRRCTATIWAFYTSLWPLLEALPDRAVDNLPALIDSTQGTSRPLPGLESL